MAKKRFTAKNESKIENSTVGIGDDYVVGGKGNRNYYIDFPVWGTILMFVFLGGLVLAVVFFLRPQSSTTSPIERENVVIPPPSDTVFSESPTVAPTPSAPSTQAQRAKTPNPVRKSAGTKVKLIIESTNEEIRAIAEDIVTAQLLDEGLQVVTSTTTADFVLKCRVTSQIKQIEKARTLYLPTFSVNIRLLQLPEETTFHQLSLTSPKPNTMLTFENEIPGAFRSWFSPALSKKSLRKNPT